MLERVSMKNTETIIKAGGKVEKNRRGQLIVYEKRTRETHPEWFVACKESYVEDYFIVGYIQPNCYKKVMEKIEAETKEEM